ncbi:MAG: hypothetical protein DPW18_17225 [Chloroflexi bacterium]|nr:hypothetical protein [Chloroflexota bacterium]MDL1940936.1 hypothetical protein [Chloroflexi bacterium CFX2]
MYIDPGSGGMLFQILAVAFTVISGTVLMFSSRIKMTIARWRRAMRKEEKNETTAENNSEQK